MDYFMATRLDMPFEQAVAAAKKALKAEGFGILTEIDVQATLKEKLGVSFRKYQILGACHPSSAHRALELEDKIGLMLPCNVIVQEASEGRAEIAAVDPVASMQAVDNPALSTVAGEVRKKLSRVIEAVRAA